MIYTPCNNDIKLQVEFIGMLIGSHTKLRPTICQNLKIGI